MSVQSTQFNYATLKLDIRKIIINFATKEIQVMITKEEVQTFLNLFHSKMKH